MSDYKTLAIPREFVWRRLHSLMGLWLVLFLIEHLLTNSQAALWLGENGRGFVEMVDAIHNLPYLQAMELVLLGIPILIHLSYGIKYLHTAKFNSFKTNGASPSLTKYARNHAYTWQRLTSWFLLFALAFHVVKFRFIDYPITVEQTPRPVYLSVVEMDEGLYTLSQRLGVKIIERPPPVLTTGEKPLIGAAASEAFDEAAEEKLQQWQELRQQQGLAEAIERLEPTPSKVVVISPDFGTASLLYVRDAFKHPLYLAFYTLFVLTACFHAFNGFWTFLITWGMVLRAAAQRWMSKLAMGLMILTILLGLAAVWGTFWFNLRN